MRNKFIALLGILLITMSFESCDPDLVDTPPTGATEADYLNDAFEYRTLIITTYAAYHDWFHFSAPSFNFGGYVTGTFLLPGDDLTERDGSRSGVELFDGSNNATQSQVTWPYSVCYKVITKANVAIEKVQTTDFSGLDGADEIARMEGEALFLRGFAFFTLFNNYGDVPIITSRVRDLAGANTPKSPASEVLNQAIADFEAALPIVPESWDDANRGRITKNAARGMLAKAYLFRANYNGDNTADLQASVDAFNSLTSTLVPNFIDNFDVRTENNAESLYEFQAAQPAAPANLILHNDGPWRGVENSTVYRGYMMSAGGGGFNDSSTKFFITEKLQNAFGTDPRISVFLDPGGSEGGRIFQKYNLPAGTNQTIPFHQGSINNERLLRHADVVLIAAEAQLKLGNEPAARALVNQVRTRARNWGADSGFGDGVTPADLGSVDMQAIMNERWVELAGEGKRWDDLRRWQRSGDVDITGWDGGINGFSTALPSPSQFDINTHLLFPLPLSELDRNENITENNPGY